MTCSADEIWMKRCFELARRGAGAVSPNPLVGAVLVHNNRIIAEGWHERWGGPHAEVNCFRAIAPADEKLVAESVLYCNLEPCSHHGKTPPCAELVVKKGVKKLVIANTDPNPLVSGRGLEYIRQAGIPVETGVLENEGLFLNRAFFTGITRNRPYIILKWAQSADGFLGRQGERTAVSGPAALRLAHRWRSESDAILVGAVTAATDDPSLDTRFWFGKNPLRVLLDGAGSVPVSTRLLSDDRETLVFGPARSGMPASKRFTGSHARTPVHEILELLFAEKKGILYVEGGAGVLQQFIRAGYVDEIRVIENTGILGGGVKAPSLPEGAASFSDFILGPDRVKIYFRQSVYGSGHTNV
ncbi:MAG: bifunctional diaminohydroxyphosphoribosylaminopyrimidine deaminase/5-amino-6-(5-phosphoribosylamino)uracil reductase RibD [Bacteroidota bacterium]